MKSNELFEEIHCGRIKEGTKINVINGLTGNILTQIEYKEGMLRWKTGEFDTSFLCNIDIDFEVIEENKEIEEFRTEYAMSQMDKQFEDKINELVRAVNKINKQFKELETEDIETVERELNRMF